MGDTMIINQEKCSENTELSQDILGLHDDVWHRWWQRVAKYRDDNWVGYQQQALSRLNKRGLPCYRKGSWSYTDIQRCYSEHCYHPVTTPGACGLDDIKDKLLSNCYNLVVVDGCFSRTLSSIPESVMVLDILGLRKNKSSLCQQMQQALYNYAEQQEMVALSQALLTDALVIIVPEDCVLDKPIHILHVASDEHAMKQSHICQFIHMKKKSQASILESYISLTSLAYWRQVVTIIDQQQESHLNHYALQQDGENSTHLRYVRLLQEVNANCMMGSISLGAKNSRAEYHISPRQQHATLCLNGLFLLSNNQQADHVVDIHHDSKHGCSDTIFKGIASDSAIGSFQGRITVSPEASDCKAHLTSKNLLLSDSATINSKPELVIENDDVVCSHGTTVGSLDPEILLYCRMRGMSLEQAKYLLLQSYCSSLTNTVINSTIRQCLINAYEEKLNKMQEGV